MQQSLPGQTIVLLGAGHSNAHILTRWRMEPIADARLVCVSNFRIATYSGMLPGVLAGLLPVEAMQIDLVRLCRAVGAELIVDEVVGLDVEGRRLLFHERPPLRFDALSIGVGSTPDQRVVNQVSVSEPDGVLQPDCAITIKPMQTFLDRLASAVDRAEDRLAEHAQLEIAVVGGGVAGVEISLCLQPWLNDRYPHRKNAVRLVTANEHVAEGLSRPAQRAVDQVLCERGIETVFPRRVTRIGGDGRIEFDDGSACDVSFAVLATSAQPAPLLSQLDLPKDQRGFLRTDAALQCVYDVDVHGGGVAGGGIFAVGDCGSIDGQPLPKAGVYAVRQGPVLWANLQRTLSGRPLVDYQPQRDFLKLLCTGDGRAVASYRGRGFTSRFAWKWKRFIDERFMRMHQDYQPMEMAPAPADPPEIRCVGCGGKVGGRVLDRVLRQLEIPRHDRVLQGLDDPDDTAVLAPTVHPTVATVDFFAPPIEDMYAAGRIATINALNDVYAMGGKPSAALASITLPHGPAAAQERMLLDILSGVLRELRSAGATLAGGHTLEGPRVTIGLTVFGDLPEAPMKKSLLRAGDALVLTKPLGTGVLLAAHMTADCRAAWFEPTISCMMQSAAEAARIAPASGVTAATDVTGFGLAGHLLEMLSASDVSASLELDAIPLLPGAEELLQQGRESTMAPANLELVQAEIAVDAKLRNSARFRSLFDPQTSGGLLLSAGQSDAQRLVDELRGAGYEHANVIARVDEERLRRAQA